MNDNEERGKEHGSDLARRLQELEIHAAHQEETIQELSDTTRRAWVELEAMQARLNRLRDRLATLEAGPGPSSSQERPPHY